jgi:chromosome segregation ATPase
MRREFSTLRSAADEQARLLQDFGERAEQTDAALANLSDESRHGQNKLAEHYRQVQTELTNLKAEHSTLQTEQASLWTEHTSLRAEHTNLRAEHSSLRAEHTNLETEHANLANQVIELADQLRAEDREIKLQHDREIDRRLTELAAELKEEQRVCFRQVSLEASESAVLEDRARRALLQRLEKLEAALKSRRG